MGMFDTFTNKDGTLAIQLKAGKCVLAVYREGDYCSEDGFEDGIYYAPEGVVVIHGGAVCYVAEKLPPALDPSLPKFTKWGEPFDPENETLDEYHPLRNYLKRP